MTDKKPKVVAFYRDHPTIKALADAMSERRLQVVERAAFHQKALEKIKEDADKESTEMWKEMHAELVRLGLITQQEVDAGHLHLDMDTMTVQRCQGHGIGELLGMLR